MSQPTLHDLHRPLGSTGLLVSPLGLGTVKLGRDQGVKYPSGFQIPDDDDARRLLKLTRDLGINLIDTAPAYGRSEERLGPLLRGQRQEWVIVSKVGEEFNDGQSRHDFTAAHTRMSVERSLKRLKTDRLDLLQLHSCTLEQLRKGDVIEVVRRARDAGKTRFIGYSGDGPAAVYAVESGAFDTLQISVSVADQEALDLVLPAAKKNGLGVIAKRPIANAIWKSPTKPDPYYQAYWERLHKLDYDFLKADMAPAVSTALRFTLAADGVHTAIVGTTQPGRWRENADLLNAGPLGAATVQAIRDRWKAVAAPDWVGQI